MHIVVTGGSRGIGAATVRHLSALGHRVTFFYRSNHDDAQTLARETGAEAICADVADGDAVHDAFSRLGPVRGWSAAPVSPIRD